MNKGANGNHNLNNLTNQLNIKGIKSIANTTSRRLWEYLFRNNNQISKYEGICPSR